MSTKKPKSCLRYSEDNWPEAKTIGGEPWPAPDKALPHRGGGDCPCNTCVPKLSVKHPASFSKPLPAPIQLPPGVPMPDQTSATWPHVFAFACAMEYKLSRPRRSGDPASWRGTSTASLQDRLDCEVEELNAALSDHYSKKGREHDVLNEAVDVANFAMMIADCVQHEKTS